MMGLWTRLSEERRWLLGLLLLVVCLYSLLARETYGGDFRAYYVAAQASHAGLDPYRNQVNVEERFADGDWLQADSRFIYPPSALFVYGPLGRLPYRVAKLVNGTGVAVAMVLILMCFVERYPRAGWVALGLFLSLPMAANVDNGQVDVLILGLMLAAFYARRPWVGGACLGVAIAVKMAPVLVLVWLVANRRWRTAAWALGVAGAATAVAVRVWGVGLYGEFLAHLRGHLGANPAMLTHVYKEFPVLYGRFVLMGTNTFALHYFFGTRQNPVRGLGSAAGAVGLAMVVGYVVWARWRRLAEEASFTWLLVVALFANTLLWPAGLVACFPATMWLVERGYARTGRWAEFGLAMLLPWFLPVELVLNQRFVGWLVAVGWCFWRMREVVESGQEPVLGKAYAIPSQS